MVYQQTPPSQRLWALHRPWWSHLSIFTVAKKRWVATEVSIHGQLCGTLRIFSFSGAGLLNPWFPNSNQKFGWFGWDFPASRLLWSSTFARSSSRPQGSMQSSVMHRRLSQEDEALWLLLQPRCYRTSYHSKKATCALNLLRKDKGII